MERQSLSGGGCACLEAEGAGERIGVFAVDAEASEEEGDEGAFGTDEVDATAFRSTSPNESPNVGVS